MYAIVCADDNLGMLFNCRRQSQDRVLRDYLLKLTAGHRLFMNGYSAKQFEDRYQVQVSEDFLQKAGDEDFCFVEDQKLSPYEGKIHALILCRWNREYPADAHLDLDYSAWALIYSEEFPGSSHEKITVEVYKK